MQFSQVSCDPIPLRSKYPLTPSVFVESGVLLEVVMKSSTCHLLSRWFLARLILRPWRWRRHVPLKSLLTFKGLHGIIYRKTTSLSLMLRPTVSWPVCLGIKHLSGAYDQIFITVRQLRISWCGVLSLTRGQVCRLQLLLVLTSAVILGSASRGTRHHILLSQIRDFRFCRLLRLAGLCWRYSTTTPHRKAPLSRIKSKSKLC
jgi:hypothetical protein